VLSVITSLSLGYIYYFTPPVDDFETLVKKDGFDCESHIVETDDGYLLTLFRLVNSNYTTASSKILYFQHGLFDSADGQVLNGREKSLAYFYHDQGFDVWLGNNRGNKYSRKHVSLDPDKDSEFWDFTFEQYHLDVKANIEHILNSTAQEKLAVMAHSMGTAQIFIAMSLYPTWFEDRVSVMVALAPVSKNKN